MATCTTGTGRDIPPLPPADQMDTWLMKAIRGTHAHTNGLAIIIGCPNSFKKEHETLHGVEHDLRKGRDAFDYLMFVTLCLYDPTIQHIRAIIKLVSELNTNAVMLPESWRRIVVLFAGHGDSDDNLCSRDGAVSLRGDIIDPLLAKNATSLALLPKLFFIDTCRGSGEDHGIDVSWLSERSDIVARGGERVPSKGNYLVSCSTLPGMKALELASRGGFWMNFFLEQLLHEETINDDILSLMPKVNKSLLDFCNCHSYAVGLQQPQLVSTLTENIKLLHEAQELRLQRDLKDPQQQGGHFFQHPCHDSYSLGGDHLFEQQCPLQQGFHPQGDLFQQQYQPQQGLDPQQQGACLQYPQQQEVYHYQHNLPYPQPQHENPFHSFRGSQEPASSPVDVTQQEVRHNQPAAPPSSSCSSSSSSSPSPSSKKEDWKSKLEKYFANKGEMNVIEYHPKAEGYGYKSTVICPEVGCVKGERRPTKREAEQSVAKKALELLTHN